MVKKPFEAFSLLQTFIPGSFKLVHHSFIEISVPEIEETIKPCIINIAESVRSHGAGIVSPQLLST